MKPAFYLVALAVILAGSLGTLTWLCVRAPSPQAYVPVPSEGNVPADPTIYRRILLKDKLADYLAAAKINLLEAAACVRDMDLPEYMRDLLRVADPADSEEESFCRHMLSWTILRVTDVHGSEQAARIGERLEAELQGYLASESGIILPPNRRPLPFAFDEDQ